MKKIFISILTFCSFIMSAQNEKYDASSQILYQNGVAGAGGYLLAKAVMPEKGFLPGSKFPTYPTTRPFDFKNKSVKVILSDNRTTLNLKKLPCSDVNLTNKSEFNAEKGTVKVWQYFNAILPQSKIVVDSTATDILEVSLDALDSRLIGFGQIEVHGLSQMTFTYKGISKTYCTDIEDGDYNAPLKKSSMVTRKTASRYMTSASIRNTLEKFLTDFLDWKE